MRDRTLDGMLLTHPPDLAYLSDFTGHDSIGLITAKDFFLATDFRYKEQAAIEAPWLKIRLRTAKMSDLLAEVLAKAKLKRVGFEANFTTFGEIDSLRKALKARSAKIELVALDDVLVNLRKVKDSHEVQIIRDSIAIAEAAYKTIRRQLKIGQTENELAGRLIFEMRSRGASGTSFSPIIAAGSTSSLPHYSPADRPVKAGEPLLFDWGAIYNGDCSDLTRTPRDWERCADEEDLSGDAGSTADGHRVSPARRDNPSGRRGGTKGDRESRVRQVLWPRPWAWLGPGYS